MSRLISRLAKTDQCIRKLTTRMELYRNRVARASKNPAMAEQAKQLLPIMGAHLDELTRLRKRLLHALAVEAYLAQPDHTASKHRFVLPPYLR
jgi:hypothetical protein